MKVEVNELQATVHRGARAAYDVDHHFAESIPFEEWLSGPNMLSRVAEECRRVIEEESYHAPEPHEKADIQVAYAALQGLLELEQLACMAAVK
jgi:hypothetical protein